MVVMVVEVVVVLVVVGGSGVGVSGGVVFGCIDVS